MGTIVGSRSHLVPIAPPRGSVPRRKGAVGGFGVETGTVGRTGEAVGKIRHSRAQRQACHVGHGHGVPCGKGHGVKALWPPCMGFPGGFGLTCQLPLLGAHFAGSQDHGDATEIAVGDAHEEGEDAGPGGVAEGGPPVGVDAHDEEGDEDHTEAGVDEEMGPSPVVGQGSQDLQRGAEIVLGRGGGVCVH